MNISSSIPTQIKPNMQKSGAATEPANEKPILTITLPDSVSIGGAAKQVARVIPGTVSLALHSPKVVGAPILNAVSPAYSRSDKVVNERWGSVLGGGIMGAGVGGVLGAAAGNILGGTAAGAAIGAVGGGALVVMDLFVNDLIMMRPPEPSLPGIADSAYEAKSSSNGSHSAGVALRKGYAAGISEAYMKGARLADESTNVVRGFVGLEAK